MPSVTVWWGSLVPMQALGGLWCEASHEQQWWWWVQVWIDHRPVYTSSSSTQTHPSPTSFIHSLLASTLTTSLAYITQLTWPAPLPSLSRFPSLQQPCDCCGGVSEVGKFNSHKTRCCCGTQTASATSPYSNTEWVMQLYSNIISRWQVLPTHWRVDKQVR